MDNLLMGIIYIIERIILSIVGFIILAIMTVFNLTFLLISFVYNVGKGVNENNMKPEPSEPPNVPEPSEPPNVPEPYDSPNRVKLRKLTKIREAEERERVRISKL